MNTLFTITTHRFTRLGIWVAEAYLNGQQLTFVQADTKGEAESKLQDKLLNYYHIPPRYLNKHVSKPLQATDSGRG